MKKLKETVRSQGYEVIKDIIYVPPTHVELTKEVQTLIQEHNFLIQYQFI